jgi:hypothetical protein
MLRLPCAYRLAQDRTQLRVGMIAPGWGSLPPRLCESSCKFPKAGRNHAREFAATAVGVTLITALCMDGNIMVGPVTAGPWCANRETGT